MIEKSEIIESSEYLIDVSGKISSIYNSYLGIESCSKENTIMNEDLCFFDIETSGLSSEKSRIYLISYLIFKDGVWTLRQLLSQSSQDESNLIKGFFSDIAKKRLLVHYNGDSIDIPFIVKRALKNQIDSKSFEAMESLDLYKVVKRHKSLFKSENLKLVNLEKIFGYMRDDTMSGKELIKVYHDFEKLSSLPLKSMALEHSKELLLLHNHDDVVALPYLVNFAAFLKLKGYINAYFEGPAKSIDISQNKDFLAINLKIDYDLPFPLTLEDTKRGLSLVLDDKLISLSIRIFKAEYKHFFEDYKNYYYLPEEDYAIYKSLGEYVDKSRRQRAKKENCYIKKAGRFLPASSSTNLPTFRENYKSFDCIELDSVLAHEEVLKDYLKSQIKDLIDKPL